MKAHRISTSRTRGARLFWLCGVLMCGVCCAGAARADVSLQERNGRYVMENELLRVAVNPKLGGVIDGYFVKADNRELLGEGRFLLGDHFWQQLWPGEFLSAPYESKIVAQTPAAVTLEVSRVSAGWNNDLSQIGLRVSRRMTLRAGSPLLHVEVAIENIGAVGRSMGYWNQNIFYAGGEKMQDHLFFRPGIRGVSKATWKSATGESEVENGDSSGFVRDPQNGWTATLGAGTKSGLAFVMPYDELMYIYNAMSSYTTEWQYNNVAIPAGKTWRTEFVLYPLAGFERVDYASRRLAAAVLPTTSNGKLSVSLHLAAADAPLQEVSVSGGALHVRQPTPTLQPFRVQQLARLASAPQRLTFELPHDPSEPLALRFTVRGRQNGEAFEETFETWYGAKAGANWRVDGMPLYPFPTPSRRVVFLKPDKIVKVKNAIPQVLVARGLFADELLPDAIWQKMGGQFTVSHFKSAGAFPASLMNFPASYEDLMAKDVIALSNIDAAALGAGGEEMLKDFVTHGGTLVYGGDLWAFGRGNLRGGTLEQLLPVTFSARVAMKAPQFLRDPAQRSVRVRRSANEGWQNLPPDAPMLYVSDKFAAKPGAQVLAEAGGEPVAVLWKVGQGRVLALTGTSLGQPKAPQKLYTHSAQWQKWLGSVLKPEQAH